MAGRKEEAYFNEAERLYVQENKTAEQIAQLLPVSQTTIYKWSDKGGWGKKRELALTAPKDMAGRLRRNLIQQIEALESESRLDAGAYDSIYKTFLLLEKLEKAHDPRVMAVAVMQDYTVFLKGQEISPGELQLHGERIRAYFRSLE
jgi:transposase